MLPKQGYMLGAEERHSIINREMRHNIDRQLYKYLYLFESGLPSIKAYSQTDNGHASIFGYGLDQAIREDVIEKGGIQLSLMEVVLLSKIIDMQRIANEEQLSIYEYADSITELLENSDILDVDVNEKNITQYNYFFIQAFFHHMQQMLNISFERDRRNYVAECQLEYIAEMSVSLAERYTDISISYNDIKLEKDKQVDELENKYLELDDKDIEVKEWTEKVNNLIHTLGKLSKLSSKYTYIEELVARLKNQYLRMSAAEDGFKNLFEYMGYLMYIGNDHFLYEMGMNELENNIISELHELSLPDVVYLLGKSINNCVNITDLDLEEWEDLSEYIFSSYEFDDLVREIMDGFLRAVPEYFPD